MAGYTAVAYRCSSISAWDVSDHHVAVASTFVDRYHPMRRLETAGSERLLVGQLEELRTD